MHRPQQDATEGAIRIRELEPTDWSQVWLIVAEVVRAADTFTYDPAMTSEQARGVWMVGPPGRTVVAVDRANHILGTAHMDTNRPGPGAHVSTASFMVSADARGGGVGTALCRFALQWARSRGYAGMQFNAVAASNVRALAVYRREGFEIVGTVPGAFAHPTEGRVGMHVLYQEF